jgi:hypothetical protein
MRGAANDRLGSKSVLRRYPHDVPIGLPQADLRALSPLVSEVPKSDSPQQKAPLFDHLVGAGDERRRRHVEPERLCRLEVDDKLELDRGLDGSATPLAASRRAPGLSPKEPAAA